MSDNHEGALSQIEHPEREYVHVAQAFPEEVQKQLLAEAVVDAFTAMMEQWMEDDPMGFSEALVTATTRASMGDAENHRAAEGIA